MQDGNGEHEIMPYILPFLVFVLYCIDIYVLPTAPHTFLFTSMLHNRDFRTIQLL